MVMKTGESRSGGWACYLDTQENQQYSFGQEGQSFSPIQAID